MATYNTKKTDDCGCCNSRTPAANEVKAGVQFGASTGTLPGPTGNIGSFL